MNYQNILLFLSAEVIIIYIEFIVFSQKNDKNNYFVTKLSLNNKSETPYHIIIGLFQFQYRIFGIIVN